MKKLAYLFVCFSMLFLISCKDEEEVAPLEGNILAVELSSGITKNTTQQISITIGKPTPCHVVKEVLVSNATTAGKTVEYNIILEETSEACIQVIKEEVVTVTFTPEQSGEYTLKFLINGKLLETRKVFVSN